MDWTRFNTHGDAPAASIETLLSLPFERGCRARYDKGLADVYLLDGSGGDGGVETFAELTSGEEIGIQASGFGIDSAMAKRATSRNRSVVGSNVAPACGHRSTWDGKDPGCTSGR